MLYGIVTDQNNNPYENALVEVKGEDFITRYSAITDASGRYSIDLPDGVYPFLIAVKDYAQTCLECWAHNVPVKGDTKLDLRFEALEGYGLNVFRVKGGYPSLHLYFRPMSLAKFHAGETDIAPELNQIRIYIDRMAAHILVQNKVSEYVGGRMMTAYLIQVVLPEGHTDWHRIDAEIIDMDGHFGMATIFA